MERQQGLSKARHDKIAADTGRSLKPPLQKTATSRDHQFNLEIVLLLEELCQSALNDDAQGVAACSDILSETMRRSTPDRTSDRPN